MKNDTDRQDILGWTLACLMLSGVILMVGHSLYVSVLALIQEICLVFIIFKLRKSKKQ